MAPTGIGVLLLSLSCLTALAVEDNYVNVAMDKTYNQSTKHAIQGPSSNAANGNTGGIVNTANCIHTDGDRYPWWQVDLGKKYAVYNITVWARTGYTQRLAPSNITVDGTLCTTVDSVPASRQKSVTCASIMYGQRVRITLLKLTVTLNLCEFQIFDCKAGYWGTQCQQSCSDGCIGRTCRRDNGHCDACHAGYYGDACSPCDNNCDGGCDRTTGHCTRCRAGYWGSAFCQQPCPANCAGDRCQRSNGNCGACKPGHYGDKCRSSCNSNCEGPCEKASGNCPACKLGHYGEKCMSSCSSNCEGPCEKASGNCQVCKEGYYGPDCPSACPSNCNGGCDKTTGHCTDCADGYYRHNASLCIPCEATCYNNTPCNTTTGHCHLCPPGKTGDLCEHECASKTYGQNCSESCGQCKGGQPCDTVTGTCTTGCEPGYTENDCKTNCSEGLYGEGCNETCSNCAVNTTCHHEDGHCLLGCAPGFTGSLCEQLQQETPIMSATVGAVVGVLVGAILIVAVVAVIVIRRRKRQQKRESANGAVTYSNVATAGLTADSGPTCNDDSAKSPGQQDAADKSADGRKSYRETPAQDRPKPTAKAAIVMYENVSIVNQKPELQSAKSTTEPNAAAVETTPQQNGAKTTVASGKKKGKPPVAAKPSKGRALDVATKAPPDTLTEDEEDFGETDVIYANEDVYANVKPTGMRVDRLLQSVVDKLRDGTLAEEFVRLIPKKNFATKNGERKENYYKNRFNNILPYDKNRVELTQVDGDDASDYVNASFVAGYKMEKAYMAAQGPRDNTVDDFWRMVWQEGVTDIVMLTNLKEANKPKCYEYWPAQGDRLTTGHMEVTGVEEETRAHFVIRTFDLRQADGGERRRVKQYHYQSWMDHEVPATTPLVNFWRYVRSRAPRTPQAPPLLVHCSAGVGRTGTFIAMDLIYDQSRQETEVDIFRTVDRLRDDRCHMVQNKSQYRFLHEAVLEAYMSGDSRIQMSDMDTVLPHTLTHHTPHHSIDTEFEKLCKMRRCLTTPTYTTANTEENRAKNRNSAALPDDKHLVYLTKHMRGRNQYINGVYMATFQQQRGCIMTQLPLSDTLVDFWRLVDGCDVDTIVSIGDVEGKDMRCYWPKDAMSKVHTGPYTVSLQAMSKMGETLCSYTLDMKTEDGSREVRVLHYAGWTGQVADNMADLLHLLTTMHTSHQDRGGKPVILQCTDGASQSGVVCALWDVISRMTCDAELDVYMAVRQLHTVRPEALTSVEQYRFCYQVAQQFKNSNSIYANT